MRHLFLLVLIGMTLAGCASAGRLPTCDGSDRRPVNAPPQARATYHSCGMAA